MRSSPTHLPSEHIFTKQKAKRISLILLVCTLLTLLITLVNIKSFPRIQTSVPTTYIWGSKPVLGYFVLTPSLEKMVQRGAGLPRAQFDIVKSIAQEELDQLRLLEAQSIPIISDQSLSLKEKQARIVAMGYNQKVIDIIQSSDNRLYEALDHSSYNRLVRWIEYRWKIERQLHGKVQKPGATRSYQIFATRYDSGGRYTVALPDQCVKFSNAGNHVCDSDGYQVNQNYSVYLTYKKSTGATVLESGPWNIDDNYWSTLSDPQPRRLFTDLGLGMPEAQAAYFNGYNGGQDQFGRTVTAPYGIDLAKKVSTDIGLQAGVNDWITVSFLWTDNWGSKSSANTTSQSEESQSQDDSSNTIMPIQVATANANGSIMHTVESGQFLWNIAAAYEIDLQQLLSLNNLTKDSPIFPGDTLIIKSPGEIPTETPAPEIVQTQTFIPTGIATPTDQKQSASQSSVTPEATSSEITASPEVESLNMSEDNQSTNKSIMGDPVLMIITGLFLAGAVLVLSGTLFSRKQ